VTLDMSDHVVREAYLAKVKAFPPERNPEAFERIRDAYQALRDPRRRARLRLLGADPRAPLVSWLETRPVVRRYVGPEAWLSALEEQ
jgi:curved DNA-binding protein CbpA